MPAGYQSAGRTLNGSDTPNQVGGPRRHQRGR